MCSPDVFPSSRSGTEEFFDPTTDASCLSAYMKRDLVFATLNVQLRRGTVTLLHQEPGGPRAEECAFMQLEFSGAAPQSHGLLSPGPGVCASLPGRGPHIPAGCCERGMVGGRVMGSAGLSACEPPIGIFTSRPARSPVFCVSVIDAYFICIVDSLIPDSASHTVTRAPVKLTCWRAWHTAWGPL